MKPRLPNTPSRACRRLGNFTLAAGLVAACLALSACERKPSPGPASQAPQGAASGEEIALADPPVILALGDSLTAGYGLEERTGYPAQLQARLAAAGYPHHVINAGVSGDTSAGGLARMDWLLRRPPVVIVLELGANDGLRGQKPEETRANLARIIEKGRAAGARVVLAGMRMPVNLGPEYKRRFDAIYPDLAEEFDLPLIPFILAGVAGNRSLNLGDGMHPNAEGYAIVVDNIWAVLEPMLEEM